MNLCCQSPKKEKHQHWKKTISMSQRNVTCHPAVILIISLTFPPLNYTDRLVGVHAEVYVRCNRKSLLQLNDVVFEENCGKHFSKRWTKWIWSFASLEQKHKVELGSSALKHLPNKSIHTEVWTVRAGNKSSFTWWSLRCDKLASTRGN